MNNILDKYFAPLIVFVAFIGIIGTLIWIAMAGHWESNPDTPTVGVHKFCASQKINPENIYCTDTLQSRYYQQCTMTYKDTNEQTQRLTLLCPVVGSSNIGCYIK